MNADNRAVIEDLSISFPRPGDEDLLVVEAVSFTVGVGEFVAVVGPSGCGKSTILRVLSGLLSANGGTVLIDGQEVSQTPDHVGFMFQKDALLPWATIDENITIGAELGGVPLEDRPALVASLIDMLGLAGFEKAYPKNLSGGMRQRVSLGRLLAYQPTLMLMDEPFGALDYQTKIRMGRELLRIWEAERRSIIFVTHDIEEAIRLADRIVVFSARPARVAAEYIVNLSRPRNLSEMRGNAEFNRLTHAIWSDLSMPT